jgi:hypothetical protein
MRLEVNRALTQVYIGGEIETIFNAHLGSLGRPSGLLAAMYLLNAIRNSTGPRRAYNACAAVSACTPQRTRSACRSRRTYMLKQFLRNAGVAVAAVVSLAMFAPAAQAQTEQQKLIADAEKVLSNFLRDPDMSWLQRNIGRSKALLIAPEILKAGFIFGGSGGRALVVARDPASGKWVGPAFYVLATGSVGFQAGISVSEGVTMVMTDKGFNSLLATTFKMGGDASVAAGPSVRARRATSSPT